MLLIHSEFVADVSGVTAVDKYVNIVGSLMNDLKNMADKIRVHEKDLKMVEKAADSEVDRNLQALPGLTGDTGEIIETLRDALANVILYCKTNYREVEKLIECIGTEDSGSLIFKFFRFVMDKEERKALVETLNLKSVNPVATYLIEATFTTIVNNKESYQQLRQLQLKADKLTADLDAVKAEHNSLKEDVNKNAKKRRQETEKLQKLTAKTKSSRTRSSKK